MVAFLMNQMNVGAFKINTLEKPESKAGSFTGLKSGKNDFSRELQSAVDEKRSARKADEPSSKRFEKKLSKVNHEMKERTKANIDEKKTQKQIGENSGITAEKGLPKEEELRTDDSLNTEKAGTVTEEQKAQGTAKETEKVSGTEPMKVEETPNGEAVADTAALGTKLAENMEKLAAELVALIQAMQKNVDGKELPLKNELTKATDLLNKIQTGKMNPEEGLKELEALTASLTELAKKAGKTNDSGGNGDFAKLMELTGNKLKVLKNEIADAKEILSQMGGSHENRKAAAQTMTGRMEVQTPKAEMQQTTHETESRIEKTQTVKPETDLVDRPEDTAVQLRKPTELGGIKVDLPEAEDAASEKTVAVTNGVQKAAAQEQSEGTGKEGQMKNSEEQQAAPTVKTLKTTESTTFQHTVQNTVKESESAAEVVKPQRAPMPEKAEVLSQIVKKADLVVGKNQSEMIMKLEPEHLGKVTLKIAVERGNLTATFQAENPQVKSIIESNANMLKDMLQEKGINISAINVSVNQQNGENPSWKNQNQGQNFQNSSRRTEGIGNRAGSIGTVYGNLELTSERSSEKNPYTRHDGKFDSRG